MKKLLAICLLSLLAACGNPKKEQNDNPAAFQEKDVVSSLKSYRSGDVMEALYNEVLEKDEVLRKLDDDIKNLKSDGRDSLIDYTAYRTNCMNYYSSAEQNIIRLGDSVLTKRIKELVTNSRNQFQQSVKSYDDIRNHIDTVMVPALERAYVTLKIIKTLPLVEKYAKENLPSAKPIQGLDEEYQKTINKVENAAK